MRLALLVPLVSSCAMTPGDADGTDTDVSHTDTVVLDTDLHEDRCDPGEPCAVIPARPATLACGQALREALAADTDDDTERLAWPARASDLACFDDLGALLPAAGVVPYDVASPLWSDGADKGRWFAVPPPATITFSADGPWGFPDGSLMLKAFGYPTTVGGPSVLVELRVMLRHEGAWHFASYRWDASQDDALLVDAAGRWEPIDVITPEGPAAFDWWFPSLDGCTTCHRDLADEVLGPRTLQMRLDVEGGGQVADQVVALVAAGLLSGAPSDPTTLPALPDPYAAGPVEDRARSWLHGQCAHCHRPGGFVSPSIFIDLRFDTPFADAHLCREPKHGTWGPRTHTVLEPGDPDRSLLVDRIEVQGLPQMPPGAAVIDTRGLSLVRDWITALEDCP